MPENLGPYLRYCPIPPLSQLQSYPKNAQALKKNLNCAGSVFFYCHPFTKEVLFSKPTAKISSSFRCLFCPSLGQQERVPATVAIKCPPCGVVLRRYATVKTALQSNSEPSVLTLLTCHKRRAAGSASPSPPARREADARVKMPAEGSSARAPAQSPTGQVPVAASL